MNAKMGIGNEMANATEFMYEKERKGLYALAYHAMRISYVLVPLVIIVLLCLIFPGASGYVIGLSLIVGVPLVGCFLLPKVIIPATFRYVQIEFEYVIKGGTMTVNHIYGRKTRKEWMAPATVSTFDFIKPYEGEAKEAVNAADIKNRIFAANEGNPDNYCAVFTNEKGEKTAVVFQATNKALQIMKFLNRNTEVRQVLV